MSEHHDKGHITLKKMFVTGLLTLVPIATTIAIILFLIEKTESLTQSQVKWIALQLGFESAPAILISFVSLVLVLVAIMLSGWLTSFYLGKQILKLVDALMMKLPFVRSIYGGTKQIIDALSVERSNSFKKVVLLEYPRKDCWVLGFVTNEKLVEANELFGRELVAVFVPSTPNPTTGFLLYLDPFELFLVDLEVDEAVKLIMSAGLVIPGGQHKKSMSLGEQLGLKRDAMPPITPLP